MKQNRLSLALRYKHVLLQLVIIRSVGIKENQKTSVCLSIFILSIIRFKTVHAVN